MKNVFQMETELKKQNDEACKKALLKTAEGDGSALSDLYDMMGKTVLFTAYSILGNYQDAEDAAQNTFYEILKCAKNYSGGDARAWIVSVAKRQALKILRDRRPICELDDADTEYRETDHAERLTLLDALDRLSSTDKHIVVAHVLCDQTFAETADELGISEEAAQKRYRRAIEKMKQYYGGN